MLNLFFVQLCLLSIILKMGFKHRKIGDGHSTLDLAYSSSLTA